MHLLWLNARTYNEESSQVSGSEAERRRRKRGRRRRVKVKKNPTTLFQIYSDSFELERGFLAAHAVIETRVYDFGNSDEEQAVEVT